MRLISWNVNGLRAVMKKGFEDVFWGLDADVFCLQFRLLQAEDEIAGRPDRARPAGL